MKTVTITETRGNQISIRSPLLNGPIRIKRLDNKKYRITVPDDVIVTRNEAEIEIPTVAVLGRKED